MKISLFGYGTTTKALAKKYSPNCDIFDDKFMENGFDEHGNRLLMCKEFNPQNYILNIPSPGFPPHHKLIKSSNNLISEYDLFENMPVSVWISGTNGKTTTTQMLEFLLEKRGAVAGGNIGTPLANLDENAPIWILETSSFTLHYTKKAKPNIYLLLPIKDDHISWHGSFKAYEEAKLKPLFMMEEGSVAIVPSKYLHLQEKSLAMLIGYEDSADLAKQMNIDIDKIEIKEPFLLDAVLALSAQMVLFDEANIDKINSFKIDKHKLEELHDNKGRLWVNDTKGTNIDATIEAIKRYKDRKIYIILGGDDKGVSLNRLFEAMKNIDIEIFAIGSNMSKIEELAQKNNINAFTCKTLDIAVSMIDKKLDNSSVGLLSPAAASLDQFSSYVERGELFVSLVKSLK